MSGKNVAITAGIALLVVLGVQYYQARKNG